MFLWEYAFIFFLLFGELVTKSHQYFLFAVFLLFPLCLNFLFIPFTVLELQMIVQVFSTYLSMYSLI